MKQSMIVLLVMTTIAMAGCSTLLGEPQGGNVTLVSSSDPYFRESELLRKDLQRRWSGYPMRDDVASAGVAETSDEPTAELQEFIDTLNQLVEAGRMSVAERNQQWDHIADASPELLAKFLPSVTAGLKHRLQGHQASGTTVERSASTERAPERTSADTNPAAKGLLFHPADSAQADSHSQSAAQPAPHSAFRASSSQPKVESTVATPSKPTPTASGRPAILDPRVGSTGQTPTPQTPARQPQPGTIANPAASAPATASTPPLTNPLPNPLPVQENANIKQTSHVAASKPAPPQQNDRVVSSARDERPQSWQDHVLLAVAALERERPTAPSASIDTELETRLRLLQLAVGRKEEALADLPKNRAMSAAERRAHQDFLQAVVAGLDEYMRHDRDEFEPAEANLAKATSQFRRAADRLGQLATLEVKNVALCRKVDDYGVVEPFVGKTFHSEQEVMLYAEVENFVSELVDQSGQTPMYRTALKSSYRVFDSEGREVGKGSAFKTIKDLCRSYRRDFFVAYRIYLPQHMYDGTHTLTLTIEDTLGQKIGQGSVQLEVTAGKNKAATGR